MSLGIGRAALVLTLAAPLAAVGGAQPADDDLPRGVRQVQEGAHQDAVTTLGGATRRLAAAPGRERDLAQAHLWLGLAHAHLGQEASARASFREALTLDPTVRLAEGWPPKVAGLFASVRGGGASQAAPSLSASATLTGPGELEKAGRVQEAEAAYRAAAEALPADVPACRTLSFFLHRTSEGQPARFEEAISTLERCAAIDPRDPEGHHVVATLFFDKAYKDPSLGPQQKARYADRGVVHADRALQIQPDFVDALIYKALFLRIKVLDERSPGRQKALIQEAEGLQARALAIREKNDPGYEARMREQAAARAVGGVSGGVEAGAVGGTVAGTPQVPPPPVPPPAPPPPPQPVRVGGAIKEPKKLKSVGPVYPPIAQSARVQGIVILECLIGTDGRVTSAKILRGIPLLDQAAIDAVRQWVYTPTLLNGVPVPVIMTVTVNFTLQ